MTTRANALTRQFATNWDNAFPSAVFSGIVADPTTHDGGYHFSIEDNTSTNYSVTRVDDKAPPGTWSREEAAACDMSMNKADMVTVYNRVHAVWADLGDPRRGYFNAWNVWDGSGDAVRLDFVTHTASFASADHKWHTHAEWRRRYVNDNNAYDAAFSMLIGETKAAWIARHNQAPSDPTPVPPASHTKGTRTLELASPHMTGADVTFVQKFIGPARAGAADGDFGPSTRAGVIWYQGIRGLTKDGVVGPLTWRNMGIDPKY